MAPRDPRQGGDDQQLPPIRPPDEDLTRDYGPIAPEPKWGPPPRPFNREKFLLFMVAGILATQFGLLVLAGGICGYGFLMERNQERRGEVCPEILSQIRDSAGESLAVLLALLGGGTIAASEINRRRDENDPRGRS